MFKGIDLSYVQDTTPPLTGFAFVIVKASQENFVDPMWTTHSAAVRKAGLPLIAYHYLKPASITPIATQVNRFLATAAAADYLFVDEEGAATDAETQQFLDIVRRTRECGLYHSACGFAGTTGEDAQWVADYRGTVDFPKTCDMTKEFPGWDIWQYTSKGKVAGYAGDLDLDYMNPKSPLVTRLRIGYVSPVEFEAMQRDLEADAAAAQEAALQAGRERQDALDQLRIASSTIADRDATIAADQAALTKLSAALDAAPGIERERLARALGNAEAERVRTA